ncbi:MAG: hypothetical protein KC646_10375 [Candidatus Cloacimonetes bacterium]|nr:hypothetical protein [Candidatus Cloacimonadota bacterium]
MQTFIIVSRSIIESEIWDKPPLYIKVWLFLIIKAQHKDYKDLKRGQLRTSIREIQEGCSWHCGFRKETPTIKKIRYILDWLRNPYGKAIGQDNELSVKGTMVGIRKGTQGMLVTIDKYNTYQDLKNYGQDGLGHTENPMGSNTNQQWTGLQGHNINNNEKNEQEEDKKIKQKKEILPLTPPGESSFDSKSSKIVSINENKKFKDQSNDSKTIIEKRVDELKKKFGVSRVSNAYDLFEEFVKIGKNRSDHKELQSIKNICTILKKQTASFDDLKRSIENYKASKSEKIEEGYIFSCANFFGRREEYTNYTSLVIELDPMDAFYKEMEEEIYNG